jgi:hypothetical protein
MRSPRAPPQRNFYQRRKERRMFGGVQADELERVFEVGQALARWHLGVAEALPAPIRRSGAKVCSAGVAPTVRRDVDVDIAEGRASYWPRPIPFSHSSIAPLHRAW